MRDLVSWEEYLRSTAVPREIIDDFLQRPNWTQFDSELGYVLHNSLVQWGVDGSRTIERFQAHGARFGFVYADRQPRINSYGNSFTECNQVSDGETWQEYLGGHFGEPIGNYGVGGHGVYQALRRMLRQERTPHGAEYLILYIWGDDPTRSLLRARWAALHHWWERARQRRLFQGNFWAHLEMDLSTGSFVDRENRLSTAESLYRMCDAEWMLENLHDDFALQLHVYAGKPDYGATGPVKDLDREKITQLADALKFRFDWSSSADRRREAFRLLNVYAQRAAIAILAKARAFARSGNKKLLVVLNYTARHDAFEEPVVPYDGARNDQEMLDYLRTEGFEYFDMNAIHQEEYERSGGSYSAYMRQYQVTATGHYSPRGNHFFAYAIKDKVLGMLKPKPLPYRNLSNATVDFAGYLPGTRAS